jgi:hypothetical protein
MVVMETFTQNLSTISVDSETLQSRREPTILEDVLLVSFLTIYKLRSSQYKQRGSPTGNTLLRHHLRSSFYTYHLR